MIACKPHNLFSMEQIHHEVAPPRIPIKLFLSGIPPDQKQA